MKCKCYLNNDYEVIGLCDIEEFNKKTSEFNENSWSQVSLSKKIKTSKDKPPIKNVTKLYLNIKLTSNEIITTPVSDMENVEGVKLTGKLLLVSGIIYQNIIYVSDEKKNSIHSIKEKIPFNTYIVVDETAGLENDRFCVYPCAEDVSLIPSDERNLSTSITLFLFAHRIIVERPKKLDNFFIFNSLNNNEMVRVEFEILSKKIIVTSTGENYGGGDEVVFNFTLKNSSGNKVSLTINGNEDGEKFINTLNDIDFEVGDEIVIVSKDKSKAILTNFPANGEDYEVPNGKNQTFVINSNSITPILLSNKITVKSINNKEVLSIQFSKENRKFIVSSTGVVPDPSSTDPYFTLVLTGSNDFQVLKGVINSNEDGSSFKTSLNNKSFLNLPFNYLVLLYKDKSKIEISNYPSSGNIYVPNGSSDILGAETNNLVDNSFPNKIKILGDNNEEVSFIQFSLQPDINPVTTFTGAIGTNAISQNIPYIEFLHYQSRGSRIFAQLLGRENASNFVSSIDKTILNRKPIRLFNKISNRVSITNYKGQGEYRIGEEPEFLNSNGNELVPYDLNYNKIRLKNRDSSTVLFIYFDKTDANIVFIEPYSTGIVNRDSNLFSFKIADQGATINKVEGRLNRNQTGDNIYIGEFQNSANITSNFRFQDILTLEYSDKSLVEIYDFPFTNPPYNPEGAFSQRFRITRNGLTQVLPVLINNAFIFKTSSGEEMAKVQLDLTDKKLVVTSTGKNYGDRGNNVAFLFELKNSRGTKASGTIRENGNAQAFLNALNGVVFEVGDNIDITHKDASKAVLTNFPDQHDNSNFSQIGNKFVIKSNSITPILSPNKISVKSKNNQEVLSIQFNTVNKTFVVSSKGIVADSSSSDDYFTLMIKQIRENPNLEVNLKSNENASNFKTAINNKSYDIQNSLLILMYKDKSKIEISNYPNDGNSYIPNSEINIFEVEPRLSDEAILNKIKILGDNDELVACIRFSKGNNSIVAVKSTGNIGANSILGTIPYVELLHYDHISAIFFSQILGKKDASEFARGQQFKIPTIEGNPIRLFNKIPNRIIITDYKNQSEYRIREEPEFFKLSNNALVPHNLNYDKIRLINRDGSTILYIYFDKLNNAIYIEPYSTGIINRDSDFFSFKITDPSGVLKNNIQGRVNKGQTADNISIVTGLNQPNISKEINFGDILILEYSDKNLVQIFGSTIFRPTGNSIQKFEITQNGLNPLPNDALQNSFIFKNLSGEEMAKVNFDKIDKKLVVTTTDKNYGGANRDLVINVNLEALAGAAGRIFANENADGFKHTLNNVEFQDNNIISVECQNSSTALLTNFPRQGRDYTVPVKERENFIITQNGVTPYLFLNRIIIKSKNDEEVLTINFNKENNTFDVQSTGVVPDPTSSAPYFTLTIRDVNSNVLVQGTLNSNENGENFKNAINNREYLYPNSSFIISQRDRSKIEIINYPELGDVYVPQEDGKIFKITNGGFNENEILNIIKIANENFDGEVSNMRFSNGSSSIPVASNVGFIGAPSIPNNIPYVEFLHYKPNEIPIFAQILGGQDASEFVRKFSENITPEMPIRLFNRIPKKIIMTFYKGERGYLVGEEPEFFKISGDLFVPYDLNYNKIKLKNSDGSAVLYIYFDKIDGNTIYIEPYSTGKENLNTNSFSFKITDPSGAVIKVQGRLNRNQTGDNINVAQTPNGANISKGFSFGDTLTLDYSDKNLVEVFDFPFNSPPRNPTGVSSQKFVINPNGLQEIIPPNFSQKYSNTFLNITNVNGEMMVKIEFDLQNQKLVATSTGVMDNSKGNEFVLCGVTLNTDMIKLLYNTGHSDFIDKINNQSFDFGDVLTIHYFSMNHIRIDNYPSNGEYYTPRENPHFESFKIEEVGLIKLT